MLQGMVAPLENVVQVHGYAERRSEWYNLLRIDWGE